LACQIHAERVALCCFHLTTPNDVRAVCVAQDSSPDTASVADTEVSAASTSISPHHNEQHLEYLMAGIHDMMSSGDKHPAGSPRHVAAGAAGGRPNPMPDTLQGLGLSFNAQYYAPGESSTAAIRKAAPQPPNLLFPW
jgi:hypothetical protein